MASKKPIAKQALDITKPEQIKKELAKKQVDLIEAKRSHRLGELTNPHILTVTRREIARLKTALTIALKNPVADKEDK